MSLVRTIAAKAAAAAKPRSAIASALRVSAAVSRNATTLSRAAAMVNVRAAAAATPAAVRATAGALTARLTSGAGVRAFGTSTAVRAGSSGADLSGYNSQVAAVLGAQWGDEGKGKLVDILAGRYDIVARFNGGANAGHTLVVGEGAARKKFAFHLLPCGMLYANKINLIGNGVVLQLSTMMKELKALHDAGITDTTPRLRISDRAALLFDFHTVIDGMQEKGLKADSIGTTKRGIGPCYASKITRNGLRVADLAGPTADWDQFTRKYNTLLSALQSQFGFEGYNAKEELDRLKQYRDVIKPMVVDGVQFLNEALRSGKTVLAEGANAALLDIDHGTYPYVTSSSTTAGGICTGLGLPPSRVQTIIGVVKAYTTRVGSGPFPTELNDAIGEGLRARGGEFGTTTGRPRRCGWLDVPVVQYSHALNGYASLNITKLDVLSDLAEIKIGVAYKLRGKVLPPGLMPAALHDLAAVEVVYESMPGWRSDISKVKKFDALPAAAKNYLRRVEVLTGIPISWVGVGAGRLEMATQGFDAK